MAAMILQRRFPGVPCHLVNRLATTLLSRDSPGNCGPGLVPQHGTYSTAADCSSEPQLLREFIFNCLYHPVDGYFASTKAPVGSMDSKLSFSTLLGRNGYNYKLRQLYQKLQVRVGTPELMLAAPVCFPLLIP